LSVLRAVFLAALVGLAAPVHAGRPCEPQPVQLDNLTKAMSLAQRVRDALDVSGAQVALVARVGQDLSRYKLRYSHLGFAWRDHPKGRWIVTHELNTCGTAESGLFDEGLGNFFLDDMFAYESKILIPSPDMQAKLAAMLGSDVPLQMHHARYNMLAYVYSTQYQNSNQWVLEAYAAAIAERKLNNRDQAQQWLRQKGFEPITVHLLSVTRLGARMFKANVAFDDHPFARRMAGQIDTATVDSITRFVRRIDPGAKEVVVAGQ
jgi:hypothetical protein